MTIRELASVHAATLHDVLQRASRIAPTKGAAFDRAQGIHLTFANGQCEVRATDMESTFWQVVPADLTEPFADPIVMRLPSVMFIAFVASLPMAGEQVVRFRIDDDNPKQIIVKYANTKLQAKMNLVVGGSYPEFVPTDVSDMTPAQELANRIEQVAWAVGDTGPLRGILVSGEHLFAMDSKQAARTPCVISVDEPSIVVLAPLVPLIKLGTDIRMKIEGGKITLALDDSCQITSSVILQPYPAAPVDKLPLADSFTVNRVRLIEALTRLLIGVRNDRQPRASLTIIEGALDMKLLSAGAGEIEDSVAIASQVRANPDEDVRFVFSPSSLITPLSTFTDSTVTINYGLNRHPWHISGGSEGVESWVSCINPTAAEDS